MNDTAFSILLAGTLCVADRVRGQVAGTRVIAADSGIKHAAALGLDVELWVGDFDSCGPELTERYGAVERQTHPYDKDATDGELAINEALARGARSLVLVGGFGGRSDHVWQHFLMALALARKGVSVLMTSGDEEAWPLLAGDTQIDVPANSSISIVPLADLEAISLSGVKWPLCNRDVPLGSSLTMSNVTTGPVKISLAGGHGMVIAYPE